MNFFDVFWRNHLFWTSTALIVFGAHMAGFKYCKPIFYYMIISSRFGIMLIKRFFGFRNTFSDQKIMFY
uniref:Putative product n=1 Tax=Xenopsylla cheopis TaxID=163159 RepID=A0A6M2E382_XENCH